MSDEEKETRRERRQRELDESRPPEMFEAWSSQPLSQRMIISTCMIVGFIAFYLIITKVIF